MDFDFYAGGIEDAIIEALKSGMTGVKMIETYSGQLDDPESLKAAIASKARSYPLVMVSYGDGVDVRDPATSAVLGRSLIFRHDCSFAVICVSTDARGETERRRGGGGTYAMIGQVRRLLTGLRFSKMVTETVDDEEVEVKYLLTTEVLVPVANEYIAKLPNMTAYAVIFATAFKWKSPDRTEAGIDVTELIVGVTEMGVAPNVVPEGPPGVSAEVGS